MALIKGITIILYEPTQTGRDDFNQPVYENRPVEIENVLISPVSTEDIITELQLSGKRAVYELCIPRGIPNAWEDRVVEFFGQKWHTIGIPQEYIEANVPLEWNKKVRVERYG